MENQNALPDSATHNSADTRRESRLGSAGDRTSYYHRLNNEQSTGQVSTFIAWLALLTLHFTFSVGGNAWFLSALTRPGLVN